MAKKKNTAKSVSAKKTPATTKKVAPKKTAPANKKAENVKVAPKKNVEKVENTNATATKITTSKSTSAPKKTSLGVVILWILALVAIVVGITMIVKHSKSSKMETQARELVDYLGEMSGGLVVDQWTWKGLGPTGMYEMEFTFVEEGLEEGVEPTVFTSYVTKDGKMIYTGDGYLVDDLLNEMTLSETEGAATATSTENISKSATPMLSAYIVTHCPYGLQAQKVMLDAIEQAPEIANHLEARYFFDSIDATTGEITAMHGQEEADENLRQICLREEQKDIYWDYVSCYYDAYSVAAEESAAASSKCVTQAGGNASELTACVEDLTRGIAYAQADQAQADTLGITGSPTIILNGTQEVNEGAFGGRSADGYKNIICGSADNALSFCAETLSENTTAANGSC